jgi:perosamine synthetase
MINIYNTYISPDASEKVNDVLASTFLSEGMKVKEFEQKLSSDLGLHHPVALNSGTTALHLALDIAGIKKGDEVILPAQTFVASGLTIIQQQAKPVFADINYETGNISIPSIEQKITPYTKAIMPVHWGGYPCDMDEIQVLAKKHNLLIIEDAAHALGATYKNKAIGSIGDFTCFSFQAIKHLTTGDGGALCCKNAKHQISAIEKKWFGINRTESQPSELGERIYNISEIGYKYHLNDYAASLGLANIEGFKLRLANRLKIAKWYDNELKKIKGIRLFNYNSDRESAYWLYGFHVENRLDFIRKLKGFGITASVIHQRIDRNSIFGGIDKSLENQKQFDETQIHIPIHDGMTLQDAQYITETIKKGW